MLWLYCDYGTIILVIIEAPKAGSDCKPRSSRDLAVFKGRAAVLEPKH